jgi:hypothetical protein
MAAPSRVLAQFGKHHLPFVVGLVLEDEFSHGRWDGALRQLNKADEITFCIFCRCHQLAASDVFCGLLRLSASVEDQLKTFLDVAHVPEGHGTGLPVRGQTDVLVADLEADVIRVLDMRLNAQKLLKERLGAGNVGRGIKDGFDALVHLCALGFMCVRVKNA